MKKRLEMLGVIIGLFLLFTATAWAVEQTNYLGEELCVTTGTVYWETSQKGGSGRYNTVSPANTLFPQNRKVVINGYSFLDEKRELRIYDPDELEDKAVLQAIQEKWENVQIQHTAIEQ